MTIVESRARRAGVVPDQMTGTRVHGPYVVGNSDVENTVDQKRRTLESRGLSGLKGPRQTELLHVLRVDLSERTMTFSRVIAVISWPRVGPRMN